MKINMSIKYKLLLFLGVVLLISGCNDQIESYPEGAITSFEKLENNFANPPKEYGSAPLYNWNGTITKEGLDADMQVFKDAGFGGVFVHPRPGLITEYLSDEWFDLFRYTVDKGKELDLNVWIYDENSFPSGFAGGHLVKQMPEAENQGQGLQPRTVSFLPDNVADYYIILKKSGDKFEDITEKAAEEKEKKGEYFLYKKRYYSETWYGSFPWFGEGSYVDLLYPGVTEKFIEITMTGYEKVAGDEFGKAVPGVFTDEPEINTPGGIRWTPDLFEVFEKQWGYDLKLNLPSLSEKVGDWKKVRHNYAKTLLWLFIERWSKPQYKYCKENNLIYTGHYWEHGWPGMALGPDNMAMYAYHQMPGIDMLFNRFDEKSPGAQFGNIRSVKELASVANQLGRHRTLSETYGGAGFDLTFEDMKRLGDWQYVLGVNFLNQHFSSYTLTGARKYDWPGSFKQHAPWWDNYKYLNYYYRRLSMVLSSGKQKNDILVIEPTSTIWMYDSYVKREQDIWSKMGHKFQWFVTSLEKNQVEYDLGSEDIINNHGSVDDKKFVVGKCSYSRVVIPPMTENINESTFLLLKEFAANGGEIIAFSKPTRVDGAENEEIVSLLESEPVKYFSGLSPKVIREDLKNIDLEFTEQQGGNLYHNRRKMKDGQILFLANSSLEESTSGQILINGKDAVVLDAFTGKIKDYSEIRKGNQIELKFSLHPAESLLLFVSENYLEGYEETKESRGIYLQAMSGMKVNRSEDNVLTIDFCDLTIAGKPKEKNLHTEVACSKGFMDNGYYRSNPWGGAVQYKSNIANRKFKKGTGFTASYWFSIEDEFDYSGFSVVVENPTIWKVSLNGQEIKPKDGVWKIDQYFGVYPIGDRVKQGKNEIRIDCYPMNIMAEIQPIYIMGDFSLKSVEKGWVITALREKLNTGSWKKQGHPFYPWGMNYQKTFEISEKSGSYYVGLDKWKGTAVGVTVNDENAGTIALHTDRLDVTSFVKEGKNEVVVEVVGSVKNLFGPFHNNPAHGFINWGSWGNVKSYPEGEKYHQLDYGLMGDFYLLAGH